MILSIVKQYPDEMSKKRHSSGFSLPGPAIPAFRVKNSRLPPMFIKRQEAGDLVDQGRPIAKNWKTSRFSTTTPGFSTTTPANPDART